MITLSPAADRLPALTPWLVQGRRLNADGSESLYTGTSWGRSESDARRRHERLVAIDRANRQAARVSGADLDLSGYELSFSQLPME